MTNLMEKCAILGLLTGGLTGCSNLLNPAPGVEVKEDYSVWLPQMVIEPQDFNHDIGKICKKTHECTAPLVCDGQCIVPPSITGRVDEKTPRISFTTPSGKHEVLLEVVDEDYTMQRGLMMRKQCLPGWGMLFIYSGQAKRAFWMHNTYIPLDMVFFRADGSVSNVVENAEPLNDGPRYMSTDKVKYVLELPAGKVAEYGIVSGSTFDVAAFKKTYGN